MNVAWCCICGGSHFQSNPVLWPQLIADWQLAPDEVEYINRQQGKHCTSCWSNLRSMALGNALKNQLANYLPPPSPATPLSTIPLAPLLKEQALQSLSLLEINEAGSLSPTLRQLTGYCFGAYPEVDMHAMPYADGSFDIVVHSDTLEHVQHPIHALAECHRVLKPGGALCMTVPVVIGRLSRSRAGLPLSFHGTPQSDAHDYAVHTEFGADAWTYLMQAGFTDISMHSIEYPAALAFCAKKII